MQKWHTLWGAMRQSEAVKQGQDDAPLVPLEKNEDRRYFEFRHLTRKEKKEFMNSLNSDGRRMLAELLGKADVTPRSRDQNSLGATSSYSATPASTESLD